MLIKKFLICTLSCIMIFAAFSPSAFAEDPPLCIAAREGNLEEVWRLVDGVDVNCSGSYERRTPLHFAILGGHLKIVEFLVIEVYADVNCADIYGETPLHWAVEMGKTDIVKFLVNHGADVNCRNNDGITPLYFATHNGHLEIAKYIVDECRADVDCRNNDGYTPLHCAAVHGKMNLGNFLVQHDAFVYMPSNKGETPIGLAQRYGHFGFAQMLINANNG